MNNPTNPIYKYYEKIVKEMRIIPTVVECGSCNGADTQDMVSILMKHHKVYRYYAFEMDRRMCAKAAEIGNTKNVTFINKAVGSIDGVIDGHFVETGSKYYGSSSIKSPLRACSVWPGMKFNKGKVGCIKLDTFCESNSIDHIDFIYADVQGAEQDLILGATNTLKKCGYFYTEYSGDIYDSGGKSLPGEILKSLSGKWQVLKDFGGDVLFKNGAIA